MKRAVVHISENWKLSLHCAWSRPVGIVAAGIGLIYLANALHMQADLLRMRYVVAESLFKFNVIWTIINSNSHLLVQDSNST